MCQVYAFIERYGTRLSHRVSRYDERLRRAVVSCAADDGDLLAEVREIEFAVVDIEVALEDCVDGVDLELLEIAGGTRRSREAEVGEVRAAEEALRQVLLQLAGLMTVDPIPQGLRFSVPSEADLVPRPILKVAKIKLRRELAASQALTGLEDRARVCKGVVVGRLVLPAVE